MTAPDYRKIVRRITIVLAAGILWWVIYRNLEGAAKWITYTLLSMPAGTHLSSAIEFFIFETPKVLMLLTVVVFGVGIIRSFFTPERTRRILEGKKEAAGNVLASLLGVVRLQIKFRMFSRQTNNRRSIDKSRLFKDGYISSKSGHTRGSTVDLTIVALKDGKELDMGSPFDLFGPISHYDSELVPPEKLANRLLLRALMTKSGFIPYSKEWWHFTLAKEPFPGQYFNFPVE